MPACDLCNRPIESRDLLIAWEMDKTGRVIQKLNILHRGFCDQKTLPRSGGPSTVSHWDMMTEYRRFEQFWYASPRDKGKVLAAIMTTGNCTGAGSGLPSMKDIFEALPPKDSGQAAS